MVYLIDDDESVRKALQRLLRSAGFEVMAFSSAEAFFQSANFDIGTCIILDVRMPVLTGFDVQEKLALMGIQMPVITISAFDDAETRERARKLGAMAFFRKPVDGEALIDTINWATGFNKNGSGASKS